MFALSQILRTHYIRRFLMRLVADMCA